MMTLQEAPCAVYTVKKINGSRDLKRRMENMGIAAGADVEVIEHTETVCRIKTVKREIELSVEEAASGIGQTKLMKTYNKKEMKDHETACGKT